MNENWMVPKKLWEGGDVWILGGGPSVTKQFGIPSEVVQAVLDGRSSPAAYSPYMKAIHKRHVIGINVAYLIGDWIDMVFFGDNGFFLKHKGPLYKWPGMKVSCANGSKKYPWVKFLSMDGSHAQGITTNPKMISWNGNSGAAAITVAANAGAKRIFLLGFDMKLSETDDQHWHGLYKDPNKAPNARKKNLPFMRHLRGFPAIARDARARGIEIYNVCPDSAIEEFPKITLEQALLLSPPEVEQEQTPKELIKVPSRILVIGMLYNEMKYLPMMVQYWKNQGVEMYYIDNYSTDGTYQWLKANGIPTHRFSTQGSFDLSAIQKEIANTLHRLKPDWFIYGSADLYYAFDEPIVKTIQAVSQQGFNQIRVANWNLRYTGEQRDGNLFGTYYHGELRGLRLTMISRYDPSVSLDGDSIHIDHPRAIELNGLAINFGDTKPASDREKTFERRKKAWAKGVPRRYGRHYIEGHARNWKWNKQELTDIRCTNEYRYYENARYILTGEKDTRVKITLLSQKDYAGSGWRIVQAMRLFYNDRFNIESIVRDGDVAFGIPCGWTIDRWGKDEATQRIQESDILHFKGDWPYDLNWEGIGLPKQVKRIHTVAGSFFRKMKPGLNKSVAMEKYSLNQYRANFLSANTPDLCYAKNWHWMPFVWFNFDYQWKRADKFIVMHIPSTGPKKGTPIINQAMQEVLLRRDDVIYIERTNVPYQEMLKLKKSAHLYIDQLIIDAYSNAAVEAMGYGIPVLSAIGKSLYPSNCPVIAPEPSVLSIVEIILKWLDWDKLEQLSRDTFEYCKAVHGSMASRWSDVYESVLRANQYGNKVAVVIPTCNPERKPFLDFLEQRLSKQTRQPDMILKVDYPNLNGQPDLSKRYREGCRTAFEAGMDLVVFMEDDDYYPLNYIEEMVKHWEKTGRPALIGHNVTRYYHLGVKGYKVWGAAPHASAHCSAVGRNANLEVCPDNEVSFDLALWRKNNNSVKVEINPFPVSIKHGLGMSGGRQHALRYYKHFDPSMKVLSSWVDADAFRFYKSIASRL